MGMYPASRDNITSRNDLHFAWHLVASVPVAVPRSGHDMKAVLAIMHDDVVWANGLERGHV
jgi:hypothetical protein